ncbi:WYL domain-containing protein [Bacillus spongiae]|uniref:WYL domain-containing protein n=1 Tax=Bacillus spongiae TaxID=2683610 RepID=A0ABU8HDC6_9BACI
MFDYMDKDGEASVRKVEPYKVIFKESSWYLQAFSLERNDYRTFKLARMSQVRLSENVFIPKNFEALPMNGSDWMTKDTKQVTIKIDKSIKDKVIERFGEEYIIADNGNEYIAKYSIVDNKHGYNVLLKFGDKCEIIEPQSVRENFEKYLQSILYKYSDD